jgi:hypothetical protein
VEITSEGPPLPEGTQGCRFVAMTVRAGSRGRAVLYAATSSCSKDWFASSRFRGSEVSWLTNRGRPAKAFVVERAKRLIALAARTLPVASGLVLKAGRLVAGSDVAHQV